MADGYFSRRRGSFKAYLTVQANPGNVVTVTGSRITYTGTANSTTGIATFEVKKKDVYTITTNSGANSEAEGNTPTVNINKTGTHYNAQMVKITVPTSLGVGNYSSNALTAYWARPTANWSGVNLRRNTGSAPANRNTGASVYSGVGNANIVLNNSNSVNGYTNTGLTASTTYYYSIFSYLNINGADYWSTTYRTGAATATNYVGLSTTITSTRSWSIPAGWRSIQVFCVGGGGGGNRGGGGGGYTRTSGSISVVPGTSYALTIGAGGSANGGRGGTTSFSNLVSAAGGYGGGIAYADNGGAGGSGGGAMGIYRGGAYDCDGSAGASDGAKAKDNVYYTGAAQAHTIYGGAGQGSTTRAWGSSSGALYAGGGGGGSSNRNYNGGAGGAGGGGRGSSDYTISGTAGTANTGGGGGGGAYNSSSESRSNGGNGGSGVMIIKCVA